MRIIGFTRWDPALPQRRGGHLAPAGGRYHIRERQRKGLFRESSLRVYKHGVGAARSRRKHFPTPRSISTQVTL